MNSSSDFKENVFKTGLAIDSLQAEGNIIKRVCNRVVKAVFSINQEVISCQEEKLNRSGETSNNKCLNHSLERLEKDVKK